MAGKTKRSRKAGVQKNQLCENLSFAASEAYKLLRTNLQFSLPEKNCHVIGVTSSVRGEGKSTTSVNLSYTIAQSGKRVMLIDADMRLPSVAAKLELMGRPGAFQPDCGPPQREQLPAPVQPARKLVHPPRWRHPA